jgi:hypothetical protein
LIPTKDILLCLSGFLLLPPLGDLNKTRLLPASSWALFWSLHPSELSRPTRPTLVLGPSSGPCTLQGFPALLVQHSFLGPFLALVPFRAFPPCSSNTHSLGHVSGLLSVCRYCVCLSISSSPLGWVDAIPPPLMQEALRPSAQNLSVLAILGGMDQERGQKLILLSLASVSLLEDCSKRPSLRGDEAGWGGWGRYDSWTG